VVLAIWRAWENQDYVAFFHVRAGRCLTRWTVVLHSYEFYDVSRQQRSSQCSRLVLTSLDAGQQLLIIIVIICIRIIIIITSACVKRKIKLRCRRKFSFSAQIIALFTTYLHAATPSSLLAVPHVTAHQSTASVSTLYYSTWHYSCLWTIKG